MFDVLFTYLKWNIEGTRINLLKVSPHDRVQNSIKFFKCGMFLLNIIFFTNFIKHGKNDVHTLMIPNCILWKYNFIEFYSQVFRFHNDTPNSLKGHTHCRFKKIKAKLGTWALMPLVDCDKQFCSKIFKNVHFLS